MRHFTAPKPGRDPILAFSVPGSPTSVKKSAAAPTRKRFVASGYAQLLVAVGGKY